MKEEQKMAVYIDKDEVLNACVEKGQQSKRYKLGEKWELNYDEIKEALESCPRVLLPDDPPKTEKPPIGVKPYYIAIPQRIKELAEAIERYTTYDYKVSTETWAYEILCLLRVMEVMIKTSEDNKK